MQKLSLHQSLQQKLSPQQIQFIKLLQVPTAELEGRIEEELELNPVLEEGEDDEPETQEDEGQEEETPEAETEPAEVSEDIDIKDYLRDDDYNSYKTFNDDDEEEHETPIVTSSSLHETLMTQLGFLGLESRRDWDRNRGREIQGWLRLGMAGGGGRQESGQHHQDAKSIHISPPKSSDAVRKRREITNANRRVCATFHAPDCRRTLRWPKGIAAPDDAIDRWLYLVHAGLQGEAIPPERFVQILFDAMAILVALAQAQNGLRMPMPRRPLVPVARGRKILFDRVSSLVDLRETQLSRGVIVLRGGVQRFDAVVLRPRGPFENAGVIVDVAAKRISVVRDLRENGIIVGQRIDEKELDNELERSAKLSAVSNRRQG